MSDKRLKVGIVPKSQSLGHPTDRRRFVAYARDRGLDLEIVESGRKYDVIVLSQQADVSYWARYPQDGTKIIYDAADSYILVPSNTFKGRFRGLWKFLTRQSQRLQFNYTNAVKQMCARADAVVCTTEEQQREILQWCDQSSIILDTQDADVDASKSSYENPATFNFVWEGLASGALPLKFLIGLLKPISEKRSIALHLVTDLSYYKYGGVLFKRVVADEVSKIDLDFADKVFVHEWSSETLSKVAIQSDLALIPLDLNDTLQRGKPENKLLLFWRMGVPTLTSAAPAYVRAMAKSELDMVCETPEEWREKIERYMNDEKIRETAAQIGRSTAEVEYSESEMFRRWDEVFATL